METIRLLRNITLCLLAASLISGVIMGVIYAMNSGIFNTTNVTVTVKSKPKPKIWSSWTTLKGGGPSVGIERFHFNHKTLMCVEDDGGSNVTLSCNWSAFNKESR